MQSLIEVVSENVKFYRKKTGLSQLKFAYQVEIAPSYLAEIERGKQYPSLKVLERLAAAFAIDPYLLLYPVSTARKAAAPEDIMMLRDLQKQLNGIIEKKIDTLL